MFWTSKKFDAILRKLDEIASGQHKVLILGEKIMATMDELVAQVAATVSVEASAVQAINALIAQVQAAGTDPAKLAKAVADMQASSAALAAAIAAAPAPTAS